MIALVIVLVLVVIFGPQLWARHVLNRYTAERSDLPGTGAELARHLLVNAQMTTTKWCAPEDGMGDHFDPQQRHVALSEAHYDKRSLAAAVVAAHEVGHAIQHYIGYRPLFLRTRLAVAAAARSVSPRCCWWRCADHGAVARTGGGRRTAARRDRDYGAAGGGSPDHTASGTRCKL